MTEVQTPPWMAGWKPRPSPFVLVFGSFDAFVESIHAGYVTGAYDKQDMADVIAALRKWESDGTWAVAYAG